MVQAALYQLVLDRKVGEYELPEGASLIACGNRESDRGVVHRMPTPLASRFVHLEIRVDAQDWCAWGAANGISPEVLFFVQLRPDLLHRFDPQSREAAFACPRTWEFVSHILQHRRNLDPVAERALFRGTVGEAAAVEFGTFLKVWRELPHPRAVIDDPENAVVPDNASALIALCGSLYRMADDINLGAIVTYAHAPAPRDRRVPGRLLHPPRPEPAALARLHPLGRRPHPVTPPFWEIDTMDLTHDAMLVSPCASAPVSGRLYGPQGRATMSPSITRPPPAPGATTSACCRRPPSPRSPPP